MQTTGPGPREVSGVRGAPGVITVVALLAAETIAVVTLARLGHIAGFALPRRAGGTWMLHASSEDLFAVAARLAGLALAWWLLASTVFSVARRVVPGCRRLRALDALTPARLRHALDRALAIGVGASLGLASMHPAGASTRVRVDTPVVRAIAPAPPPAPGIAPPVTQSPRHSTPPRADGPRVVIVRAGDNLWVIARRALDEAGLPADAAAIAPYWRRVIEANRANLRSHDPDLIYPGERIVLPHPRLT